MAYCVRCDQWFRNNQALKHHKTNSDAHWICDDCNIDFGSFNARREHHIISRYHHYCRECDRLFELEESRIQHMEAKHWYCRTHDRVSIPSYLLHQTSDELTWQINYYRSSRLNPASNCTTARAPITTSARSVGTISMMRINYGTM